MRIDILLVGIFIIAWGICGSITAFRDRKKFLGEMTETVNAVVDKVYYRWSRSGAGYFVVWKYSFRGKRYTSEELATALIVPVFEVGEKRKIEGVHTMQFLKDKSLHVGSQLVYQFLYIIILTYNYSAEYINYEFNSLAFVIGWLASTFSVYLTVDRLINRWLYKEPLTASTFTPPLAFVLLLLVSYVFDGLTGEVSNAMTWVNLIASLCLSSLFLFYEEIIKEEVEEKPFIEKKEEPLPKETPFKLTSFNNDVNVLWNRMNALLHCLDKSNIEEVHIIENIQRSLHQMEENYTKIPHGERTEADVTIQAILAEFNERITVIEKNLSNEYLTELKKIQIKYEA